MWEILPHFIYDSKSYDIIDANVFPRKERDKISSYTILLTPSYKKHLGAYIRELFLNKK